MSQPTDALWTQGASALPWPSPFEEARRAAQALRWCRGGTGRPTTGLDGSGTRAGRLVSCVVVACCRELVCSEIICPSTTLADHVSPHYARIEVQATMQNDLVEHGQQGADVPTLRFFCDLK